MSSFTLQLGLRTYTVEDILNWNGEHVDLYFRDALDLTKDWLDGSAVFQIHTSGSTGTAKEIKISRDQIIASATKSLSFFDLQPGDTVLCPLSIHVVGGKMMLFRSIIGGLHIHIINPDRVLKDMDMNKHYDFMPVVPLQLSELLHHPEKCAALNRLKHLLIGGSSISDSLLKEIHAKLTCTVWQSYGMTETVSHIALRRLNPLEEPNFTVLNNIEIDADERSCLKIKGDVTGNQWIQTNDIVEIQDSNHFHFMARADFVINSGGIKIQVEKLEHQIQYIFDMKDLSVLFFVYGIPDPILGEKVILLMENIHLTDIEKNRILNFLKADLPRHHAPKEIFVVPFTYTASGKLNRKETIKMLRLESEKPKA